MWLARRLQVLSFSNQNLLKYIHVFGIAPVASLKVLPNRIELHFAHIHFKVCSGYIQKLYLFLFVEVFQVVILYDSVYFQEDGVEEEWVHN